MWGAWFGGQSSQKRKDAPKKAILDLRQQLEMLQKRERHLENQMARQDDIARENVTTNKTGRPPNARAPYHYILLGIFHRYTEITIA